MDVPVRIHVDRARELERFEQMLAGAGRTHILLISAASGMGKSWLLLKFRELARNRPVASVNLRDPLTPKDILEAFVDDLGRSSFPTYEDALQRLPGVGQVVIRDVKMEDSRLSLTHESDVERRNILTRTFFDDLTRLDQIVVLILDTYEAASDEVKHWLSSFVLSRVRGRRNLILVIAGQRVPELDVEIEEWSLRHDMEPLDRESVAEYVRQKQVTPSDGELDWIMAMTGGLPLAVATAVDAFLRRRGAQT